MRPNQLRMSVVLVGVGNDLIASMYLGRQGEDPVLSDVTWNPAKSASICANWNLSGLKTIPEVPAKDSRSIVRHQ